MGRERGLGKEKLRRYGDIKKYIVWSTNSNFTNGFDKLFFNCLWLGENGVSMLLYAHQSCCFRSCCSVLPLIASTKFTSLMVIKFLFSQTLNVF